MCVLGGYNGSFAMENKGMQTDSTPGLFNRHHCNFDMGFACDGLTDSCDYKS